MLQKKFSWERAPFLDGGCRTFWPIVKFVDKISAEAQVRKLVNYFSSHGRDRMTGQQSQQNLGRIGLRSIFYSKCRVFLDKGHCIWFSRQKTQLLKQNWLKIRGNWVFTRYHSILLGKIAYSRWSNFHRIKFFRDCGSRKVPIPIYRD